MGKVFQRDASAVKCNREDTTKECRQCAEHRERGEGTDDRAIRERQPHGVQNHGSWIEVARLSGDTIELMRRLTSAIRNRHLLLACFLPAQRIQQEA
jgi:hypothetical protein